MRQTALGIPLILLAALASCVPAKPEITPSPSLAVASVLPPATVPPDPTRTPAPLATATFATPPILAPTQPDEQVYIDPEGWFSLAFPAQWTKKSELSYVGSDGFLEIDYLPEYAFVPRA